MSLTADLTGKTVFVTGASSGLGRHFTGVLARAGATVVVAARRIDALRDLERELMSENRRVLPYAMDVRDSQSVRNAAAQAIRDAGRIDVLVNNAGIVANAALLDQSEEQWDSIVDTNLKGAFLVSTEIARQMQVSGGGSIINIASILGIRQAAHVGPYAVSKAGMIQLTKLMAFELARFAIRVNAIAPGYIETDMNREFWASTTGAAMIKRIPQRRLGRAEDLDGVLLLLASDASRYITGSVLPVDGGHLVSTL